MRNAHLINRRKTRQIMVGDVPVGGDAPISVQTMTNTETTDVDATLTQIRRMEAAGVDIVRVSVPTQDAAEAFKQIRSQVRVPLVADIHFDYRIALKVLEYGVDCLRINPGNIGSEDRIRMVVDSAKDKGIPIRIGVNAGSLGKVLLRKYKEPNAEGDGGIGAYPDRHFGQTGFPGFQDQSQSVGNFYDPVGLSQPRVTDR
jgi:(E)-4-hydroxy-3-methylbut-2-enyl-diphosphate synthase